VLEGALSEYRFTFKTSAVASPVVERPKCEECQLDMWLLDIKPAQPGQDVRTFECARCGVSKTILCRSER
jgi:hypothetical protein